MKTPNVPTIRSLRSAWSEGRIKRPQKTKHVWATRVRLELAEKHRDLGLFNWAINSKLRGSADLAINTVFSLKVRFSAANLLILLLALPATLWPSMLSGSG